MSNMFLPQDEPTGRWVKWKQIEALRQMSLLF
jgi:hypothetical protein